VSDGGNHSTKNKFQTKKPKHTEAIDGCDFELQTGARASLFTILGIRRRRRRKRRR
jgi:hypothetical protein